MVAQVVKPGHKMDGHKVLLAIANMNEDRFTKASRLHNFECSFANAIAAHDYPLRDAQPREKNKLQARHGRQTSQRFPTKSGKLLEEVPPYAEAFSNKKRIINYLRKAPRTPNSRSSKVEISCS